MLESQRWLATKRHLKRCAVELNRIAKINGRKVEISEKMLDEMLPDLKVEEVYGIASLFTGWRLAKNTLMIVVCFSVATLTYFVLMLNSTRMGGNPFLAFLYQSSTELPAFLIGRWLGDRIGRRLTNASAFFFVTVFTLPILLIVQYHEYETYVTILVVIVKFFCTITFFAANLQAMEIYPTCLRQSGIAVGSVCSNLLGIFGPYVVYLGTEFDVRYPYIIISESQILFLNFFY